MADSQKPLCSIGSVIHIGDWSGVVESINRTGVVVMLDNGKRMAVDRKVIEDAVCK